MGPGLGAGATVPAWLGRGPDRRFGWEPVRVAGATVRRLGGTRPGLRGWDVRVGAGLGCRSEGGMRGLDVAGVAGATTQRGGVRWSGSPAWCVGTGGPGCRCDGAMGRLCPGVTARLLTRSVRLPCLLPALGRFQAFVLKGSVIQWFGDKVCQVLPGFTYILVSCLILPFAQ